MAHDTSRSDLRDEIFLYKRNCFLYAETAERLANMLTTFVDHSHYRDNCPCQVCEQARKFTEFRMQNVEFCKSAIDRVREGFKKEEERENLRQQRKDKAKGG